MANHRFQPMYLPPLRYGKSSAEAGRSVNMEMKTKLSLFLMLVPSIVLGLGLLMFAPHFGKTAQPFWSYLFLNLACAPFILWGAVLAFSVKLTSGKKLALCSIAIVTICLATWPMLPVIACMMIGPLRH